MPSFKFRLQTLFRLRERTRDERREQLADALRVDDALRLQLEELGGQRALARRLQTLGAGPVDVDRLLEAQRYEASVQVEILHVEDQRRRVTAEIETRRAALVEADRELKVLEKLRATRLSEHLRMEAAWDVKRLDEAASRAPGGEVER